MAQEYTSEGKREVIRHHEDPRPLVDGLTVVIMLVLMAITVGLWWFGYI